MCMFYTRYIIIIIIIIVMAMGMMYNIAFYKCVITPSRRALLSSLGRATGSVGVGLSRKRNENALTVGGAA